MKLLFIAKMRANGQSDARTYLFVFIDKITDNLSPDERSIELIYWNSRQRQAIVYRLRRKG